MTRVQDNAAQGPVSSRSTDRLPDPVPLTQQKWHRDVPPYVSVCCATYNHERFIEECLDGFLIQETTFPVEIIVHDDASTDQTAEIVRGYSERYPGLFRPVLQTQNQRSLGRSVLEIMLSHSSGRYVALCDGDDYWTDPTKLEKQATFLDAHSEFVLCGHDARVVDEEGVKGEPSLLPDAHKRDYNAHELACGRAWILTNTLFYRNVVRELPPEMKKAYNPDTFLCCILGQYGGAKYMGDEVAPAVYRRHAGGIWSSLGELERAKRSVSSHLLIWQYYQRMGLDELADEFGRRWFKRNSRAIRLALKERKLHEAVSLIRQCRRARSGLSLSPSVPPCVRVALRFLLGEWRAGAWTRPEKAAQPRPSGSPD